MAVPVEFSMVLSWIRTSRVLIRKARARWAADLAALDPDRGEPRGVDQEVLARDRRGGTGRGALALPLLGEVVGQEHVEGPTTLRVPFSTSRGCRPARMVQDLGVGPGGGFDGQVVGGPRVRPGHRVVVVVDVGRVVPVPLELAPEEVDEPAAGGEVGGVGVGRHHRPRAGRRGGPGTSGSATGGRRCPCRAGEWMLTRSSTMSGLVQENRRAEVEAVGDEGAPSASRGPPP